MNTISTAHEERMGGIANYITSTFPLNTDKTREIDLATASLHSIRHPGRTDCHSICLAL
jgi:hypothetical protein